tara:strand:+ start:1288 stop:1761 length:474 start_codon:yes stop_codon:yes gene_type:complete
MIRKYKPSDYDFVLNGVVSIQKKIKMSGMPLVSKNRRSKQEMSARFLKKLILPQNLCFIFLDSSGKRIGFTCFKPINSKVCFFEFFFKDKNTPIHSALANEFKNHVKEVKEKYEFEEMYASLIKREKYETWISMAKKHFNAEVVSSEKNKKTVKLNF